MSDLVKRKIELLLLVVGFGLMSVYFVIGVVNIVRGYSIQSYFGENLFLAGFVLTALVYPSIRKKEISSARAWVSIVSSILFIGTIVPDLNKRKYYKEAESLYKNGQYSQALHVAYGETDKWYLVFDNNHYEILAWDLIAQCYCQQADFVRAIEIYEQIIAHYPGFYALRSSEAITKIKAALVAVEYYPDRLPEYCEMLRKEKGYSLGSDVDSRKYYALLDIAQEYKYPLNCHKKAKEIYESAMSFIINEQQLEDIRKYVSELKVE